MGGMADFMGRPGLPQPHPRAVVGDDDAVIRVSEHHGWLLPSIGPKRQAKPTRSSAWSSRSSPALHTAPSVRKLRLSCLRNGERSGSVVDPDGAGTVWSNDRAGRAFSTHVRWTAWLLAPAATAGPIAAWVILTAIAATPAIGRLTQHPARRPRPALPVANASISPEPVCAVSDRLCYPAYHPQGAAIQR